MIFSLSFQKSIQDKYHHHLEPLKGQLSVCFFKPEAVQTCLKEMSNTNVSNGLAVLILPCTVLFLSVLWRGQTAHVPNEWAHPFILLRY